MHHKYRMFGRKKLSSPKFAHQAGFVPLTQFLFSKKLITIFHPSVFYQQLHTMSFFELVTNTQQTTPAILLVDSSGSTKETFNRTTNQLVFDKMEEIAKTIPNDMFRVIFWNSSNNNSIGNFKSGIFSMPHIVKKQSLHQVFEFAKKDISSNCLTYPHIGFNAIPNDWINNISSTHIYFFTDGEITTYSGQRSNPTVWGYMASVDTKTELKKSITTLFKTHNNVHLHLITVEPRTIDLNNVETMNSMAGGDVFRIFKDNNLTSHITEFKSFTHNNPDGYKHIDVVIPPEGFIPYEQNYFSETNTAEFIEYIATIVESKKDDEEFLIKVIQNLTTTIRYLVKDKLPALTSNIIHTFCRIFQNTVIDSTIAEFMLRDTTAQQTNSIVYAEYRKRVKEYFKQAEEFLAKDVKTAIGIKRNFISLPIDNIIVTGDANIITENWMAFKKTYPNSSITINDVKIPVLPFENSSSVLTDINEQCIRQYVRAMISALYNINAMDDYVIYIVLCLVLRSVVSDNVPNDVKNSIRQIGVIMMKKKRLNTTDTELEYFAKGHVPTPNDCRTESFAKIMNSVKNLFNITCNIHTLWYAMCLALNHEELALRQLIHCNADIMEDFPNIVNAKTQLLDLMKTKLASVTHIRLSRSCYVYSCIYTGKDTSATGGFIISTHGCCSPQYVISIDGFNKVKNNATIFCPDCYTKISSRSFVQVAGKPTNSQELEGGIAITNKCFTGKATNNSYPPANPHSTSSTTTVTTRTITTTTVFNAPPHNVLIASLPRPTTTTSGSSNNYVIFMKGTVGSGKTTFSNALQQKLAENGIPCFVTGTDKYCIMGYSPADAVQQVKHEIANVMANEVAHLDVANPAPKLVLIIDTCGESASSKNTFGYDLSSWKSMVITPNYNKEMQDAYLSWSLNNVLKRERFTSASNYYLNKFSASEQICYDVHHKKAKNLFNKKIQKLNAVNYTDVERYQKYLEDVDWLNKTVEQTVRKIVG